MIAPGARPDREREARESAATRRGMSIRLGTAGLVLLFLGAIGTLLWPDSVSLFLVVIVAGFILIFAAFLLVQRIQGGVASLREWTKSR